MLSPSPQPWHAKYILTTDVADDIMTSDCNSDDASTAKENLSSDYEPSNILHWENNIYSRISATAARWCTQASVYKKFKEAELATARSNKYTTFLGHTSLHVATRYCLLLNIRIKLTVINTEMAAHITWKLWDKLGRKIHGGEIRVWAAITDVIRVVLRFVLSNQDRS